MKKLLLILITILFFYGCKNTNTIKFIYPEVSGVVKGFDISVEATPEGSLGCGVSLIVINTNLYKNDFYLEVRAIDEKGERIDVENFKILNIKPTQKIQKLGYFKDLKFCLEISKLELYVK